MPSRVLKNGPTSGCVPGRLGWRSGRRGVGDRYAWHHLPPGDDAGLDRPWGADPANHPIRKIPPLAEAALRDLEPTFERMYAQIGCPSIPPGHLLKSCLLMALYSIRSERQFCERLRYDLLFKWFLGLNVEDEPFDHSSFAKNRRRLLEHRVSRQFFEAVVGQARRRHLLSSSHFTVDGTLLEAWASMKSLRPRD